jgi:hypothetical protein
MEHTLITIRNERSKTMARKYKQIHRKEIDFDIKDWEIIERRAEACHTTTSKYLRQVILNANPTFYDMKEIAPLLNGMRIISSNINQIARKANETNNIYAEDVEILRKEVSELSRTVNVSLSTLLSRKV